MISGGTVSIGLGDVGVGIGLGSHCGGSVVSNERELAVNFGCMMGFNEMARGAGRQNFAPKFRLYFILGIGMI